MQFYYYFFVANCKMSATGTNSNTAVIALMSVCRSSILFKTLKQFICNLSINFEVMRQPEWFR